MQEPDTKSNGSDNDRSDRCDGSWLARACRRLATRLLTSLVCRARIQTPGEGVTGACLLVSNLATPWDALLLARALQRPLTVVMHPDWLARIPHRAMAGLVQFVPLSFTAPQAEREQRVYDALRAGRAVCVFAEGMPGWNGQMRRLHPWFERLCGLAPLLPAYIGPSAVGDGSACRLWFLRRPVVTVLVGHALHGKQTAWQVRQAILACSCGAYALAQGGQTLAGAFLASARRNGFRHAVADTTGKSLSYGHLLVAALAMRHSLWHRLEDATTVGILLPASVGGVIANLAVTLSGRVPVNINFTLARDQVDASIRQSKPVCLLTSRAFLEKLGTPFTLAVDVVYLEDLAATIGTGARLRALLQACVATERQLAGGRVVQPDDTATILFSSGSTGEPKGVMLRHANLLANVWQIRQVFPYEKQDRLCGILPFFHSFGLTATMWAVLLSGASAAYHPNPLEGERVGKLVRDRRLTLLLATPGFMRGWLRRVDADAFQSLRALITGAEHLPATLCEAFERRFGICPREGYGITELSPVVSVNIMDRMVHGYMHVGTRAGTVGHPLPGMALQVRHPEHGTLLGPGEDGVLEVKGPNVMCGYLDRPALTTAALQDGWYRTGDVVALDEDGFITIRDRLARFSKIGGEMVPHEAVERVLEEQLPSEMRVIAVVAVPDARRGERLIVCYTPEAGSPERLHHWVRESGLPPLWQPRRDDFMPLDALPVLGSGKLDLGRLQRLAEDCMLNRPGKVVRAVERLRDSL